MVQGGRSVLGGQWERQVYFETMILLLTLLKIVVFFSTPQPPQYIFLGNSFQALVFWTAFFPPDELLEESARETSL